MSHKQKQDDFYTLYEIYGEFPDDICGAFCNTWKFMDLLKMPTKKHAKTIYEGLITSYFDKGIESPDCRHKPLSRTIETMSSEAHEIFVRNGDIKTKQDA